MCVMAGANLSMSFNVQSEGRDVELLFMSDNCKTL